MTEGIFKQANILADRFGARIGSGEDKIDVTIIAHKSYNGM